MKKVNDTIIYICRLLIMIMIPAMTLVVFAQVVMRYVFLSPFIWAEELARYLLLWISCLGAAYGLREGAHIAVMFLHNRFGRRSRFGLTLFIHLTVIGFFMVCCVAGFQIALAQWDQISPGLQLPMTWAYLSIPVGFTIMALLTLELLIADCKKFGRAS